MCVEWLTPSCLRTESSDVANVHANDRRAHRIGRGVLVSGLILLAVGGGYVVREYRAAQSESDRIAAERAKYARLAGQAAKQPLRYEVSFVQFALGDLARITAGAAIAGRRYRVVASEVAQRIRSGRPPLNPNFSTAPHNANFDGFARAFREGRVRKQTWVVALLVTRTRGDDAGGELRLEVNRRRLGRYAFAVDPLYLLEQQEGRQRIVSWTPPKPDVGSLIPLCLFHEFTIPRVAANAEVLRAAGGHWWRLVDHVVLEPKRLYVRRAGGQEDKIALGPALRLPLVIEPGAS